jgi:hypothetical protein
MDARVKPGHDAECVARLESHRPHGEERRRRSPQDEAERNCGAWIPGPALARRPGMTKEHVVITGLVPGMTTTSQALKTIIKIKYVLTLGNCRSF